MFDSKTQKEIMLSVEKDSVEFYKKFFNSNKESKDFIKKIIDFENNVPLKMMNLVRRLIILGDEQKRDSLKVLFIVMCIEGLYKLSGADCKKYKCDIVIDFFKDLDKKDRDLILRKFTRCPCDDEKVGKYEYKIDVNIEIFGRVINEIRNRVVHEGVCGEFAFSNNKENWMYLNIRVKESKDPKEVLGERHYNIQLIYKEFRDICIKGMIKDLKIYFENQHKKENK